MAGATGTRARWGAIGLLVGAVLLALVSAAVPLPVRAAGGPDLGITITDSVNHQGTTGTLYTYTYTVTNAAGADPITAGHAITMTISVPLTLQTINILGSPGWNDAGLNFVGNNVVLTEQYVGAYPVAAGQTLPPYTLPVASGPGSSSITTSASVSTPGDTNPANDSTRHVVYFAAAPCVVDTPADPGDSDKRTLRDVVIAANIGRCTGDTITFDPTVFNTARTITLATASGPLALSRGVTITGPGANLLTLDGGCTTCAPGGAISDGTKLFTIDAGGTYAISGMTIQHGNGSNTGSGSGGAVDVTTGTNTVTLSGLVLRENATANGGGAVATGAGGSTTTLMITDSTIADNTSGAGGGLYANATGPVTLTNVTISGNRSPGGSGGALFNNVPTRLTNLTVTGNTGGIRVVVGTTTVTRTIIAGNMGGDVAGTLDGTSANNLIGDGSGGLANHTNGNIVGTSAAPINPLLVPLGNFGGTTPSRPPLPGSPALDAGGAGCTGNDQRGLARPQGTACDIGAAEVPVYYVGNTYGGGVRMGDADPAACANAANTSCTLRGALSLAEQYGNATVRFSSAIPATPTQTTITLTDGGGGTIALPSATLDGAGKRVAIGGGCTANCGTANAVGGVRVFSVPSGTTAALTALTVTGGNSTFGSGISVGGTLTLMGVTVSGNYASGSNEGGGGIRNSGTLTLVNSTVSGNTSNIRGGGVGTNDGTLTLVNSTVSGNTATNGIGGGIGNLGNTGTVTTSNSIIAGNTGGDVDGTLTNASANNVIGDGSGSPPIGQGNVTGAALLAPLGYYGGSVQTVALLPGSPALDKYNPLAGNCGTPATPLTADARGVSRPQGRACDAGAFESRGFTLSAATGSMPQSAGVGNPFAQPLAVQLTANDAGVPVSGVSLTFTTPTAGPGVASATLASATATTDAMGHASVTATAGTVPGTYSVTAALTNGTAGVTGSPVTFALTNTPGPATAVTVSGCPATVTAGTACTVTVTAKDQYANTATGYTGTVRITSSDAAATLPANATLTSGVGTFSVTLKTAGAGRTITATDTATSSITGQQTGITVNAGTAAAFTISGCASPITAGTACTVTVTAKDTSGNTATAYTGTVRITSSDAAAVLPMNATLTNGVGTFSVTLKTVGMQSIIATDSVTSSITGNQTGITVTAATVTSLVASGPPPGTASAPVIRAGATLSLTLTATFSDGSAHTVSGTEATYTGYNASVIAVDGMGGVTGIAVGSTTITVSYPDGRGGVVTAKITVTVTGGTGGGLMAPNPQPGSAPVGPNVSGGTVGAQPTRHMDATAAPAPGAVQPNVAMPTPEPQPARR